MKNKRVRGRKYKSRQIKTLKRKQAISNCTHLLFKLLQTLYNHYLIVLFSMVLVFLVMILYNQNIKITDTNNTLQNLSNQIQQLQTKLETEYVTQSEVNTQITSIQEQVNNTKSSITDVQTKVDNTSKEVNNIKTTSRGGLTTRQTSTTSTQNSTTSNNNISTNNEYIAFTATGYCPCSKCCGKSNGITAMGTKALQGKTVAASSKYAFGTQLEIKGMGTYTVEDRGGAIQGNKIDIYFNTHSQALAFGRKTVYVKVIK